MTGNQQSAHGSTPAAPLPSLKETLKGIPERDLRLFIQKLDRLFPTRTPDLKATDREIWFRDGQRFVGDFIMRSHSALGANPIDVHLPELLAPEAGNDPPASTSSREQRPVGPGSKVLSYFSGLLRKSTN